jgi:minor extracellular serine protease Vpr
VASSLSRSATLPNVLKQDPYTIVFSGTSMASPIAAGAIALYLEQNPQASFDQVKNAILSTIKTDSFTTSDGPLPNKTWGYGKLDIFKAMGGIWPVGIEKYISITPTVQVFPNPSNHWITFTTNESIKSGVLSIYDMTGRLVAQSVYPGNFQTIDVSAWSKGFYYYQISGGQFANSGKIIVE